MSNPEIPFQWCDIINLQIEEREMAFSRRLASCNWKSVFLSVKDNWFSYTWCQNPVVGLNSVFDFSLV